MTLLRDLITIPASVGEADFVMRASGDAALSEYVVTDDLRRSFGEALSLIGHAVESGRSQATFLHGSFGSGKSHFLAVLREILRHNQEAREVPGLAEPVSRADPWLRGKRILTLSFHMLDAGSVEQAVLEGYHRQVTAAHPDQPAPAVHRSDALLKDAARLRATLGDERFFAELAAGPPTGGGLAAHRAAEAGWTPQRYETAAAAPPGTPERDRLVTSLTRAFFSGAVRSGEYLDLDTGLQVITRHARELGYDALVLFLDEFILWLVTRLADYTFVQTEGAKLNKLVESADAARPIPIASFVARQRNLEEFLGEQVGGTERAALADVMRSVQGRLGSIVLADTNLPEITEKRLLRPVSEQARATLDEAFARVRDDRQVWDTLLLGAQYGDAGIGSDATAFRRLYPFSPALVATLVALSQALQRERTALRIMTELLVERRDTLRVNDLIGVAALFEPLVLDGELPDRPKLRQSFQSARETYRRKLRPLLLSIHGITEEQAGSHDAFRIDDQLVRTLLLATLVPEVPALQNLTAAKLHALNFGSITAPIKGYENHLVLERLRRLQRDAGELHISDDPDPVVSLQLTTVDYDKLLDLVPHAETATGVTQRLIRQLVGEELGLSPDEGTLDGGLLPHPRVWRGRKHIVHIRFGNLSDPDTMPDSLLCHAGDEWRIVIDYPFDHGGRNRRSDVARIRDLTAQLERAGGHRTVCWVPLHLTDEMMARVTQLVKVNYLLGNGIHDRLSSLADDLSPADRQQARVYLEQRRAQLRDSVRDALKQAYGLVKPQPSDVEEDAGPVLFTLAEGLRPGDPRGGTLGAAFGNLTADLLGWAYPGTPALPDDERPPSRGDYRRIVQYAQRAAADPTHGTNVDQADQRVIARICDPLRLGTLQEHRYVLTTATCWWSGELRQGAAREGHPDRIPVRRLRRLLDQPQPRGFDRDLQNLVLLVFALEQQLAWYRNDQPVRVTSVEEVTDELELREPPLPGEKEWQAAVDRGGAVFGCRLPEWRSPAALTELADTLRREARAHAPAVNRLVGELAAHAAPLGLADGEEHRLAQARRVAAFLERVAGESDDLVVVSEVAQTTFGELDDVRVGVTVSTADSVARELAGVNWKMLEALARSAGQDARAAGLLTDLRTAARSDQYARDLGEALRTTVDQATDLFVEPGPVADPGPAPADPAPADPAPADLTGTRDGSTSTVDGAATGAVAGVPAGTTGATDTPTGGTDTPTGGAGTGAWSPAGRTVTVTDPEGWERVADDIRSRLAAGHTVTVSWRVDP